MDGGQQFKLLAHVSLLVYIAILACFLIVMRKHVRDDVNRMVYVALTLWFLMALKDLAYFFGDTWYDLQVTNVLMSFDLWLIPLFTTILLYILQPLWITWGRLTAIFTPFLAFTLLIITTKGNNDLFIANQIYSFFFINIFAAVTLSLASKHQQYVEQNYSNTDHIDAKWVRHVIIMLYVLAATWIAITINSTWLGDAIFYMVSSLFATLLFYSTFKHKKITMPNYMQSFKSIFSRSNEASPPEEESCATSKSYAEIEKRLEKAIYQDRVYLNAHLSLSDLANMIGTNRTYLSRYINHYKSTPFINYINNIRLEEAQALLKNNSQNISITQIAERCGFASYSTFRRVYKQRYGHAPSKECTK